MCEYERICVWRCLLKSISHTQLCSFFFRQGFSKKISSQEEPETLSWFRRVTDSWHLSNKTSPTRLRKRRRKRRSECHMERTLPSLLRNFNQCQAQWWLALYFQLKNCWIHTHTHTHTLSHSPFLLTITVFWSGHTRERKEEQVCWV